MSIVKMKHIEAVAMRKDYDELLNELAKLGCVQLGAPKQTNRCVGSFAVNSFDDGTDKKSLSAIDGTVRELEKISSGESPVRVNVDRLFDSATVSDALEISKYVRQLTNRRDDIDGQIAVLRQHISALEPFKGCDIPLQTRGGKYYSICFGSYPASKTVKIPKLTQGKPVDISIVSERHGIAYAVAVYSSKMQNEMSGIFSAIGFSEMNFDKGDTAQRQITDAME